jgi:hypothetical protein
MDPLSILNNIFNILQEELSQCNVKTHFSVHFLYLVFNAWGWFNVHQIV